MTYRTLSFLLFLLSGLGFAAPLAAENDASGVIAAVLQRGPSTALVVNDRVFFLSPTTQIDHADGRTASRADLAEGRQIRFQYGVNEKGGLYLIQVFILSEGPTRR
jgi:hypothetical protein